jgi:hypothetical protein
LSDWTHSANVPHPSLLGPSSENLANRPSPPRHNFSVPAASGSLVNSFKKLRTAATADSISGNDAFVSVALPLMSEFCSAVMTNLSPCATIRTMQTPVLPRRPVMLKSFSVTLAAPLLQLFPGIGNRRNAASATVSHIRIVSTSAVLSECINGRHGLLDFNGDDKCA